MNRMHVLAVIVALGVGWFSGQEYEKQHRTIPTCLPYPEPVAETPTPAAPAHSYRFETNGATIYRFDSVTGEACWMQLSKAIGSSNLPSCESMDELSHMETK